MRRSTSFKQAAPTLAAIGAEGEDLYPGVWSLEEW